MSFLRTSAPVFASVRVAAARRTLMTSTVRRTDDPRVLEKDTHSGASVKADKHGKDPKTLQKETAQAANQSSSSSSSKPTAGSNQAPTNSEDAVHGEKHSKSPEQLQKETTKNIQSS